MFPPGLAPQPGGAISPQQALVQRLLGHGGPPGGPPLGPSPDDDNGHDLTPLDGVQSVIQDLHKLMELHPDPQAVAVIATCLKAMTGLQQTMMSQQGGR